MPEVEELTEGDPRELVAKNALRKARSVSDRSGAGQPAPSRTASSPDRVLGVDTAVVLAPEIFGKPRDRAQAAEFLSRLSGRTHEVMSGVALREPDGRERHGVAVTRVRFRELEPRDLEWYLATGEWAERAGGYAIQGKGAALVEEIAGDYWNVVGLPIPVLLRLAPDLLG